MTFTAVPEVRALDNLSVDISEKQFTLLRRERVGFVFQAFNLPTLTAAENVELPLAIAGRRAARIDVLQAITTA